MWQMSLILFKLPRVTARSYISKQPLFMTLTSCQQALVSAIKVNKIFVKYFLKKIQEKFVCNGSC